LALCRGESVRYLIPDKVVDYINENRLYSPHDGPCLNSKESKSNDTKPKGSKINDDEAKVEQIDNNIEKEEAHQRTRMKNKYIVKSSTNVKSTL
uniref:Uncharacterized protein n=1 Tax=Romanomermis culicivorax TaxID=13658 RepID=A0A915J0T2_ROMCU